MSRRQWMPFYVGDYRADTAHLNVTEHGAYFLLILHYWQNDGLPTDDDRLARICSMRIEDWMTIKPTIQAFFYDGWRHKRVDAEIAKSLERSKSGRLGGRPKAKEKQNESKPESQLKAPQPQPQKDSGGGGDASAREPPELNSAEEKSPVPAFQVPASVPALRGKSLISPDASEFAVELAAISGFATPADWPPGWCGAPMRVQAMLDHGWVREIMRAAARETMAKKRDGPPNSIAYFEKSFARAHAQQSIPFPVVQFNREPEKINGSNRQIGSDRSLKGALARLTERITAVDESRRNEGGQDAPRLLSHGGSL